MSRDKQDNALLAIRYAYPHSRTNDSASLCLNDAQACYESGRYDAAYKLALNSLGHSVGVFHADYQRVKHLDV